MAACPESDVSAAERRLRADELGATAAATISPVTAAAAMTAIARRAAFGMGRGYFMVVIL
jgi:hypothetical protein